MESREWTHPDVSLPELLSLIRAFVDMLLLASGYQPSGSPALWRPEDVQRALGWASLLEQIMRKVSVCEEGKTSRETLDKSLQAMMLETYPVGLPKLSFEALTEAKKLLICVMMNALGSCNGQIGSLIAASCKDQDDWAVVLQHIGDRFTAVKRMNSITRAIDMATSELDSRAHVCCCQPWRCEALSYLLDGNTLYKVSGAAVLFKCDEIQWKAALQKVSDHPDGNKLAKIAELCCLQILGHKQSVLLQRLSEPCDGIPCLSKAFKFWHPNYHDIEAIPSKAADVVEAFLDELAQQDNSVWWSLPPILVAATLRKESLPFRHYVSDICRLVKSGCNAKFSRIMLNESYEELSRHMKYGSNADSCRLVQEVRSSGDVLEIGACDAYDLVARSWCLDFVEQIDNSELKQGT